MDCFDVFCGNFARLGAFYRFKSRLTINSEAPATETVKLHAGKLKKFFFEQRGRVLERLDGLEVSSDPIFDLEEENEHLFQQFKGVNTRSDLLIAINKTTSDAVAAALQEGFSNQEPKNRLAERVKAVFNRMSSRSQEIMERGIGF